MKNALLLILAVIVVFIVSDYVQTMQTANAGWGPTVGKTPPGRGSARSTGTPARRVVRRPQPAAAEEKVVLEWEEVQVDYPVQETDEDSKDTDLEPIIKQFETAEEDQKPVIIFIYTNDMRKQAKTKREASEKYMNDVLSDPDVAEQLGEFTRLKCNVDKIDDDKDLKSKYKLTTSTPTIVLYYFSGKKYSSTKSTSTDVIISKLKSLIKKNTKAVEKLEKKREKGEN